MTVSGKALSFFEKLEIIHKVIEAPNGQKLRVGMEESGEIIDRIAGRTLAVSISLAGIVTNLGAIIMETRAYRHTNMK